MGTGTFLPVLNEVEKASIRERQPLPERYLGLSDEEMEQRIAAARAALGERLVILAQISARRSTTMPRACSGAM